jgi:ABC-2 type transport system ATP-binding protein
VITLPGPRRSPRSLNRVLEVEGVVKHYGAVHALDGVSFTVDRGQLLGFLGPNGAGKTTAMRAILGLISLDSGTITWGGRAIDDAVRRRIGYMPAERGMYPKMRVGEHVVYYARLAGLERGEAERAADRWLERVDLSERRDTDVQDLSSGNQQRVQLALAMVNDPDLLVLDEPFSGLDPLAVDILKDLLVERVDAGAALLFSSHQLDLVQDLSRDVVVIDHGRVVLQGEVDRIRRSAPHRYVTIAFAEPPPGGAPSGNGHGRWTPEVPGVERADGEDRDGLVRLRVPPELDPALILAEAERAGHVASFTFGPPELSEVFLQAVAAR